MQLSLKNDAGQELLVFLKTEDQKGWFERNITYNTSCATRAFIGHT